MPGSRDRSDANLGEAVGGVPNSPYKVLGGTSIVFGKMEVWITKEIWSTGNVGSIANLGCSHSPEIENLDKFDLASIQNSTLAVDSAPWQRWGLTGA